MWRDVKEGQVCVGCEGGDYGVCGDVKRGRCVEGCEGGAGVCGDVKEGQMV